MPDQEFAAAEYGQIVEAYHENRRIFIQVVVFLAVANVTVIGYAVTENAYPLFVFGGLFMFILYRANARVAKMDLTVLLRGLKLEKEMGVVGLMHFVAVSIKGNPSFLQTVEKGGLFNSGNDQLQVIRGLMDQFGNICMKYDVPFALSKIMSYVIAVMAALQFLIGLATLYMQWSSVQFEFTIF